MDIIKRNGKLVEYDSTKVINAVSKAMRDVGDIDYDVAVSIEGDVFSIRKASIYPLTVDDISDLIVQELINRSLTKVVTAYMTWRIKRDLGRDEDVTYKLLTKDFLSKYKHISPPMTEIGMLTYYRTYSRYLNDKKRREYWWETVARAVDYNCSLESRTTVEEAEALYDNVFNLRQFLSGRTMWSGGTPTAYTNPISQYNCSGLVTEELEDYSDICYLLMLGVGVGYNVQSQYVENIPAVRGDVMVTHQQYTPVEKRLRKDVTQFTTTGNFMELIVGDSKMGWAKALEYVLKVHYAVEFAEIDYLSINYNNVRPHGEPLKTFGGTASGPEALSTILRKTIAVLKDGNSGRKKLSTLQAMDIGNIIAEGIVVGGVRRSAEMVFCDANDKSVIESKNEMYIKDNEGNWLENKDILHRAMSNNSIAYEKKPTFEELQTQFKTIRHSSEGNFYNLEAARKRKPTCKISNPCGEILLDSKQFCNLTTINAMSFVNDGQLDLVGLLKAQRLSARAGYRTALLELELPKWNKMQKRDRLIGCSFTGWQDMVNATNMSVDDQIDVAIELRNAARTAADRYADTLGTNRSELVTTVKPEGTLSMLPTVSSGLHFSHSPYYIRRIRINSADPLVKVCEELGYPIFPEVGQDAETARTKVIEFPVKAPEGRTKYDVSAIEQLETYKMFMEHYVDHNASNTIHVRDDEWDDVTQWVYDNWDSVIGITFISLDNSFFKLLPYEACSKEEYEARKEKMKPFNPELLLKYEFREDFDVVDDDCVGGACPVR